MFKPEAKTLRILGLTALVLAATGPLHASGFLIFEQGTKAMGMAGAFTAQADDPSALFHNAGGVAFQNERDFYLGGTLVTGQADFDGSLPFPGPGVTEQTEKLSEIVPHFYWIEPINDRVSFGLGINAPFGLSVEWKDPDNFTGNFISTFSSLTAIDLNPTVGWKATDSFGIGFGVVARFSEVELQNRTYLDDDPILLPQIARSTLEGGRDEGFGWNVGLLHRYNSSFHWGFQYRSRMEIDYDGELTLNQILTGNPVIDGTLALIIPFDQTIPGKTAIEFPDIASLGLGFATSASTWLELDINWTGWTSFDSLVVAVDGPTLPDGTPVISDLELQQDWSDSWQYRLGFRWNSGPKSQWRIGYIYDETPQPEKTVSPVLPDANRNDFTFGYGYMGDRFGVDLALMYVKFDDRTVSPAADSEVPYFGTYTQDAWLLALSFGF